MLVGLAALTLLVQGAPGGPVGPAAAPPSEAERGRPAVLVTGSAGVQELGSVLSAGAGAGWTWPTTTVALLVRYTRLHADHIVFGEGERWEEVRVVEAVAWVSSRPGKGLFRLAFTAGLGPGRFVFNDFGSLYSRRKLAWSVAGGIGFGPLFLLLGRSEPEVAVPDSPGFKIGGATHLSLNLTFDPLALMRSGLP